MLEHFIVLPDVVQWQDASLIFWRPRVRFEGGAFFSSCFFFLHAAVVLDAPPRAGRVSLAPLPPREDGRGVAPTIYDALVDATWVSRGLGGPNAT